MLFQILKKDMIKRKGVNIILFLFITLATVFLSSSVTNILSVSSAVDYYMEYANVPDMIIILNSEKEKTEINELLGKQYDQGVIDSFDYNRFMILPNRAIHHVKQSEKVALDNNGSGMYLAKMDAEYCKVFDQDGNSFVLNEGDIAIPMSIQKRNDLSIGDSIEIEMNGQKRNLTIRYIMKDAAYGSEMVGMSRFMISDQDYAALEKGSNVLGVYYADTTQSTKLKDTLDHAEFQTIINTVDKSVYQMVYSFDMITAGLLIVIGICLILISMLVLRFTLVFTMEEQYQEIGIMKAIGLRNKAIKKLYLAKYLVLVSVGALLGLCISFPISDQMIQSVSENMIMASSEANIAINVLCAIWIIVIVLAFCYFCTRRLNKVSAIMAIHGGETGESYQNRKAISMIHCGTMPMCIYLGIHDILCHLRRYLVLLFTFCVSFLLITIPLNTLNTMRSDEMVIKFLVDPDSAVCVRKIEGDKESNYQNVKDLRKGLARVKQEMKDRGYDAKLSAGVIYFPKYESSDQTVQHSYMTTQLVGDQTDYAQYDEGSAPMLANEIAFSKKVLESEGWVIGDTIKTTVNGEVRDMIITGSYSDYMQLGSSARLNSVLSCENEYMFDYWNVMVYMDTDLSTEELIEQLKTDFPDYEWMSAQSFVDQNVGGIQDILDNTLNPMTAMLCGVIMLITLLMEKLFIAREKGEIAMMKSIGFRNSTIRLWQLTRMITVVVLSMIIAIPLSFISNAFVLKPIFAIMGADVSIQVDPLYAYLIYPCVLLAGIIIATIIGTKGIQHSNIKEMNNLE